MSKAILLVANCAFAVDDDFRINRPRLPTVNFVPTTIVDEDIKYTRERDNILIHTENGKDYGPEPDISNGHVVGAEPKYRVLLELVVSDYRERAKDGHALTYVLTTDGMMEKSRGMLDKHDYRKIAFKEKTALPALCQMRLSPNPNSADRASLTVSWTDGIDVRIVTLVYIWRNDSQRWESVVSQPSMPEIYPPGILEK